MSRHLSECFHVSRKTRTRFSDLEKKCLRERLLHAIFNTLLSDFLKIAVARYRFELMNVTLIWGSSKNERP